MSQVNIVLRAGFCATALLSLAACAPASYLVKTPTPSGLRYEAVAQPPNSNLSLVDQRGATDRIFSSGILPAALTYESAPIDPHQFLATNLQAELNSRGIATQVSGTDNGTPRVNLRTFRMQNHRSSGYSPFVTLTFLSADLETGAGQKRIGAFIKRGKVPVWSFDEIIEPTLNQPLSLAVKELASKIASDLYGYRASDATVDALVASAKEKREKKDADAYLDVYALGFTNNSRAVETLARLTKDEDEYVRLAAISSLGNLRATTQFDLLKTIYQGAQLWQDRAMAIKSIGDLGTDDSKAFLTEQLQIWESKTADNEAVWTSQIIRLYL